MGTPVSTLMNRKPVTEPNKVFQPTDVGYIPESITPSSYNNALIKKSWWDTATGVAKEPFVGVGLGATKYPQIFGNTVRYASGSLATITGQADELTALMAQYPKSALGRDMHVRNMDLDNDWLEFLAKSDEFGKRFTRENVEWQRDVFGTTDNIVEKTARAYGEGMVSMAEALSLGMLSPVAVYGYFGVSEAGDKYSELVDAGIKVDKAVVGATLSGILEGGIEASSTYLMLNMASPSWFVRGIKGGALEGIEEFAQGVSSDEISLAFNVNPLTGEYGTKPEFMELMSSWLFSATIGMLVGSTTGIATSKKMRDNMASLYVANGMSKTDAMAKANEAIQTASDTALEDIQSKLQASLSERQNVLIKARNMVELTPEERTLLEEMHKQFVHFF